MPCSIAAGKCWHKMSYFFLSRRIKDVSLRSLQKCREFQVGREFLVLKELSGSEGDKAELLGPGQELSEGIFS